MLYTHQPEIERCIITNPFGNPESYGLREICTVGRNSDSAYDHTFWLKREVSRCELVHGFIGYSYFVGWMGLEENHNWKIDDKDLCVRRSMWKDLSKLAEGV